MIELANKKNLKVVSLGIAAIFVIGAFALAVQGAGLFGGASGGTSDSAIGKINYMQVMQAAPGLQQAQTDMQKASEDAQKEFEEKGKDMKPEEKQKLYDEMQKNLESKGKEIVDPVKKEVDDAIKAVGKTKGLSVIVSDRAVVYGAVDVTRDVQLELQKQAKNKK
jgi:outer membrane protein